MTDTQSETPDSATPAPGSGSKSMPTSSTSTGKAGAVLWDANYIYYCMANNSWMRVAITKW